MGDRPPLSIGDAERFFAGRFGGPSDAPAASGARLAQLAGAARDLPLDRPDDWRETMAGFLDSLDGQ
ncbi:MAG TPA: hypothetical protein VHW96_16460 [Solirubrobacteraceae bacterium]|nr:hypothetical protein [Solirubrobacteraceae bacterium]